MKKQKDAGVFQLKNGNWGFRFKILINGKTVDRRRVRDADGNPYKTKRDAMRARKNAMDAEPSRQAEEQMEAKRIEAALKTAPPPRTVREVYDEFCENGRKDRAYETIRKQDSIWIHHLRDKFGERFIGEVSAAEVMDYLSQLYYEDGYAYRYVESFLKMFYLIFGQAYSRNYLSVDAYNKLCVNKDTKIHMPKLKIDEDLEIVAFTKEECAVLEDYFTGTNAETAYRLGRYCGLRINECYGLKWENVDIESGTIRVEQQMQYQEGLIKLVSLKTRNAKRTIYLSSSMTEYLKRLYLEREAAAVGQKAQREQNQTFIVDVNGERLSSLELVNCLPNGKIQTVNSMKFHSKALKEKYHINFKYHYLRHTYGTHLADMNTPTHLLCNQMGHGNIHVTERYYIALSKDGISVLKDNLEYL